MFVDWLVCWCNSSLTSTGASVCPSSQLEGLECLEERRGLDGMLVERSKTHRRKKIVAWSSKRYDFVFSLYLKKTNSAVS